MNPYLVWKVNNPLYGKKVSILSDASSALQGYIPQEYPYCLPAQEMTYQQSWFGQVIDFFGASLLSNSSLASSILYSDARFGALMPSLACDSRLFSLSNEYAMPDLILVYHDYFSSLYTNITTEQVFDMVYHTYDLLLEKCQKFYPQTRLLILLPEAYGDDAQNQAVAAMEKAVNDHHVSSVHIHDGIEKEDTIYAQQQRIAYDVIAALDPQAYAFLSDQKVPVKKIQVQKPAAPKQTTAKKQPEPKQPEPVQEDAYKIVISDDSGMDIEGDLGMREMDRMLKKYLDARSLKNSNKYNNF